MIVTCTSCQTRFRVSEDKIGPKGARIRCGRCHTIFVIGLEAPGDAAAAPPPAAPPWAEPARPPPIPKASERPPAPAGGALAGDPFAPGPLPQTALPHDPFSSPTRGEASLDDPFASAGTVADPFASHDGVAPSGQDAPGANLGGDPFELAGSRSNPVPGTLPAPLFPPTRATTDLTELLDGSASLGIDPGSLALEEREPRPPASGGAAFEQPEMDFGLSALDLVGNEAPGYHEDLGLAGPEPGERQPPSYVESGGWNGALAAPLTAEEAPLAPELAAPAPSVPAPAPTSASATPAPEPPAASGGGGRLVAALTNTLSLALLIAVAVALFLAWRGGVSARSMGPFARRPAPLVEALAVRGGLYDTAAGPAVLVVRGRVGARVAVSGAVRVRVDLVESGRVVATAVGLAGATATPEQVFETGAPEASAALRRALDGRAATSLAAGATEPFLVVFPPPAPDPRGLELRVAAEPQPAAR